MHRRLLNLIRMRHLNQIGEIKAKSIDGIVEQTTDGQRVPISIKNAEIVGFKKEWWQIWKK